MYFIEPIVDEYDNIQYILSLFQALVTSAIHLGIGDHRCCEKKS
jgi:hypothetical protein